MLKSICTVWINDSSGVFARWRHSAMKFLNKKVNDCVQHIILQKFTNFHAIRSGSFQNICNEIGWPRFLRHTVYSRMEKFFLITDVVMNCSHSPQTRRLWNNDLYRVQRSLTDGFRRPDRHSVSCPCFSAFLSTFDHKRITDYSVIRVSAHH